MRQVYVLETFEDIEHAFNGVRVTGDSTPMVEDNAVLCIHGDSLSIESKKYVLGESVRNKGNDFVLYCINRVMGKKFSADKIQT